MYAVPASRIAERPGLLNTTQDDVYIFQCLEATTGPRLICFIVSSSYARFQYTSAESHIGLRSGKSSNIRRFQRLPCAISMRSPTQRSSVISVNLQMGARGRRVGVYESAQFDLLAWRL